MPTTLDLPTVILENALMYELRLGTGPVSDACDRIENSSLDESHNLYRENLGGLGLTGFLEHYQQEQPDCPRAIAAGDVVIVSSDHGCGGLLDGLKSMECAFVLQEDGQLRAVDLGGYYVQFFPTLEEITFDGTLYVPV